MKKYVWFIVSLLCIIIIGVSILLVGDFDPTGWQGYYALLMYVLSVFFINPWYMLDRPKPKYIVFQQIVQSEEKKGDNTEIQMNVIIRRIKANNSHEALGIFIEKTQDVEAKKKLTPVCYKNEEIYVI